MNYKSLILLMMPVFWISCTNSSNNKITENKDSSIVQTKINVPINDLSVYDDIDLFNIKGIREIKNPKTYPYIKIENQINLKKRVVYKHSAGDSSEIIYEKKGGYWLGYSEFWADSGYNRTYEYVKSDKIIKLSYYGSWKKTGFHLDEITVRENDKNTMYCYWGKIGPYLEPDINNLKIIKDKTNVVITEETKRKNGILTLYSKSLDKVKNQIFQSDTTCYDIGQHSWFWVEKFGWSKKVECN